MTLEIKDHDHDTEVTHREEHDRHDGSTIKEACTDPDCQYFHVRWQPMAKLSDFGGST